MTSSGAPSQHPDDVLIRELVRPGRAPAADEVSRIRRRMASAVFGPRPSDLQDHRLKRVAEEQWRPATTDEEYFGDLRRLCLHAGARIGLFVRRGGPMAMAIHDTGSILAEPLPLRSRRLVAAFYSVDRGMLISGYQIADLANLALPEEILWCS